MPIGTCAHWVLGSNTLVCRQSKKAKLLNALTKEHMGLDNGYPTFLNIKRIVRDVPVRV